MKKTILILLSIILAALPVVAQTKGENKDRDKEEAVGRDEELLQLGFIALELFDHYEQRKWRAISSGPPDPILNDLDDNFIAIDYSSHGAKVTTKADIKSGESPLVLTRLSDWKKDIPNSTNVVMTYRAKGFDIDFPGRAIEVRVTSVWVRRGKDWKNVFCQTTRIE